MERLAAQLYTVRDFTQDAKSFAETCSRIRKMGYEGVQLSAVGPIDPKEIREILKGEGLACVATHTAPDRIEKETDAFVSDHKLWECTHPAIGGGIWPDAKAMHKSKPWRDFAKRYNKMAEKVISLGGSPLGYHNHFHEFIELDDGICAYEHLIRELDPVKTWFEIDTYWVAAAGKSPAALIRRLAHRVPCIHLKDGRLECRKDAWGPELKITEVGDGNLDWPDIIAAAKYAGVQWYIVERDNGEMEPFASLERSFHNLRDRFGL